MKGATEQLGKLVSSFMELKATKKILLFRQAEALGEHAGSMIGWTDSKLTVKGRKQAHALYRGLHRHMNNFDGIYSSDLVRCIDTAKLALSFKKDKEIIVDPRLRERNFGKDEGIHYDSLSEQHKRRFEEFNYKPEGGETWEDVKTRSQAFFKDLKHPGNYLVFTHGGLICVNTFPFGITDVIPNGSCVGLELDSESKPARVLFTWELPDEDTVE